MVILLFLYLPFPSFRSLPSRSATICECGQVQYPRRRERCLRRFLPIQQRRSNLDIGEKEPVGTEPFLD